jgi:membrane protease YdiL (CAAX protease family)
MNDRHLAIIAIPLVFLPASLTGLFNDVLLKPTNWWGFHAIYAISCFVSIGLLWLVLRTRRYTFRDIGLTGFKTSHIGWAILFFFLAFMVWGLTDYVLKAIGITNAWGSEIKFSQGYEITIIFIYAVIAGPLAEELLFRGYFITCVGKLIGNKLAACLSVLLFALYHYLGFGLAGGLQILLWGTFPTILFLWKKSLYPGILMHAVNNFVVYVLFGLLASAVK